MNKGKVRDNSFANRKWEMFHKVLELLGKSKDSEVAKSLRKKSGAELEKVYRREKLKRRLPWMFNNGV